MDRVIIYPGAIPLETDQLQQSRFTMTAIAKLAAAIFGTAGVVNGLAVTQSTVPALTVQVAAGEIYQLVNLDSTAYSSLAADTASTDQIVKQGINLLPVTLAITPPATAGQSQVYLIEATYTDTDGTPIVLPYYNASNPAVAYSGPANAGTTNNTTRKGSVTLVAKAGVAATTGTQVAPVADSGYVPLYTVTVANGAATIVNANIALAAGAPILPGNTIQGRLLRVTKFTASGTWTAGLGTTAVDVEVVGGGGAGGGGAAAGAGQGSVGGGGGGGGYSRKFIAGVTSPQTITVGAAGTATTGVGGNGGTSSFGALLSAAGGTGGTSSLASGPLYVNSVLGGAGVGGDITTSGGGGAPGWILPAQPNGAGGFGGNSPFGGGGTPALNASGMAGAGPGAGGGGVYVGSSAPAQFGGAGAPGVVIVREYA